MSFQWQIMILGGKTEYSVPALQSMKTRLQHALTGLSKQNSHGWIALAYLQKWKACSGLHGLQGLVGVGLKLRGVRLQVKWSVVNSLLSHTGQTPTKPPTSSQMALTRAHMKTAASWRVMISVRWTKNVFKEQVSQGSCLVRQCLFDIGDISHITLSQFRLKLKRTTDKLKNLIMEGVTDWLFCILYLVLMYLHLFRWYRKT